MKNSLDFIDEAQAILGLNKPLEELSFAEADKVFELAEDLYAEWSEDMLAAIEYEELRNPGLQL